MTAASGLRHCDLSDLGSAVEWPSNRSRIVVVTTALTDADGMRFPAVATATSQPWASRFTHLDRRRSCDVSAQRRYYWPQTANVGTPASVIPTGKYRNHAGAAARN